MKVSAVQYELRSIGSFKAFADRVRLYVKAAALGGSDIVVFPELFTLELLSMHDPMVPAAEAPGVLSLYDDQLKDLLLNLAVQNRITIVGGSHLTQEPKGVVNVAYTALGDGRLVLQEKLHPTPNESVAWNVTGGSDLKIIDSGWGKFAVLICYDCEFPEPARFAVDQGAELLIIPYCTEDRTGHFRVRYCAQARAVENQVYVVTAGTVGTLSGVDNMDINFAQSAIITPCDIGFARDGIAADAEPCVEMMISSKLDRKTLEHARLAGSVQNLRDRRKDLYGTNWLSA